MESPERVKRQTKTDKRKVKLIKDWNWMHLLYIRRKHITIIIHVFKFQKNPNQTSSPDDGWQKWPWIRVGFEGYKLLVVPAQTTLLQWTLIEMRTLEVCWVSTGVLPWRKTAHWLIYKDSDRNTFSKETTFSFKAANVAFAEDKLLPNCPFGVFLWNEESPI